LDLQRRRKLFSIFLEFRHYQSILDSSSRQCYSEDKNDYRDRVKGTDFHAYHNSSSDLGNYYSLRSFNEGETSLDATITIIVIISKGCNLDIIISISYTGCCIRVDSRISSVLECCKRSHIEHTMD